MRTSANTGIVWMLATCLLLFVSYEVLKEAGSPTRRVDSGSDAFCAKGKPAGALPRDGLDGGASEGNRVQGRFLPAFSNFLAIICAVTDLHVTNLLVSGLRWNDYQTTCNFFVNGKYLLGMHDLNRRGYSNLAVHYFGLQGCDSNGVPNNVDAIMTSPSPEYIARLTNAALYPVLVDFEAGKKTARCLLASLGFSPSEYQLVDAESRQEQVANYRLPFHRYVFRCERQAERTANLMRDDEVVIGLSTGSARGALCYFEQTAYVARVQE